MKRSNDEERRRMTVGGQVWVGDDGGSECLLDVCLSDYDEVKVEARSMTGETVSVYMPRSAAAEIADQLAVASSSGGTR